MGILWVVNFKTPCTARQKLSPDHLYKTKFCFGIYWADISADKFGNECSQRNKWRNWIVEMLCGVRMVVVGAFYEFQYCCHHPWQLEFTKSKSRDLIISYIQLTRFLSRYNTTSNPLPFLDKDMGNNWRIFRQLLS